MEKDLNNATDEFLQTLIKEMHEHYEERKKRHPELGDPKYTYNDYVAFKFGKYDTETGKVINQTKTGCIAIVDKFGTFEQEEEPSYDIFIAEENLLVKHVRQSDVIEKIRDSLPEERLD